MHSPGAKNPDSYFIRTFGCQMNVHDSEHIAGVLEDAGYSRARSILDAGVVIFNTCAVRKSAEDTAWGNISKLGTDPTGSRIVVVCGCMAQRHGVEIMQRFPVVDLVLGLDSLARLPETLMRHTGGFICDLGDISQARVDALPAVRRSRTRAWVPVSHGCSNYCSFCVVPAVRGRERSRPLREIIGEVEELAESGVIEVTLLGQNVNSYGRDLVPTHSFAELLESVASVTRIRRVKFETSHPVDISDEVLAVMGGRPEICEYLHIPVQSGSNSVLNAMNRGYDRQFYMKRVEKARESIQDLTVSTDIMVGFPGERERDFLDTMDLVRTLRFDAAYIFMYSPREGTAAFEMEDDVQAAKKSERCGRLNRLQDENTTRSLERLMGRSLEVMVEGPARSGKHLVSRTRGNQVVLLPSADAAIDSLVLAKVEGIGRHAARGKVERVMLEPGPR